jgi:hypothetical protein
MRILFLCSCITVIACSPNSSDIRPLQSGIAAAVSLGQTSTLAMEAIANGVAVCTSVKTACANYPCNGAVTISFGGSCPLPLGGEASGSVDVSGSWQSQDSARLTDTFTSVKVGNRSSVMVNASNLTVTRSTNSTSVRYTWQDVQVQSGVSTLSGQSSWTVDVDQAMTPGDPSDDIYTITGTDQGVSSQVSQISASNVVVKPSCRKNPVGGSATIQKVSTVSIVQSTVRFHDACDGQAEVDGQSVTLDFLH